MFRAKDMIVGDLVLKLQPLRNSLIFLDIDGTLVPDSADWADDWAVKMVEELKKNGNVIVLVTNSRRYDRNRKIAHQLSLSIASDQYRKPLKRAAGEYLSAGRERVVVGDKWVTDGLFARNIGAGFIKAQRLSTGTEGVTTKLAYLIDNLIGRLLAPFIKRTA